MAFQNYPRATATVTVDEPVIAVPGYSETFYTYGFEDYDATTYPAQTVWTDDFTGGLTTWTAAGGSVSLNSGQARSAPNCMRLGGATSSGVVATAKRTVSGLTVGRAYDFRAWVKLENSSSLNASISITGNPGGGASTSVKNTYTELSYYFEATATSHELVLSSAGSFGPVYGYWDDLTLTQNEYTDIHNDGLDDWVTYGDSWTYYPPGQTLNLFGIDGEIRRSFSGLIVGHQYTLSARAKAYTVGDTDAPVRLGTVELGLGPTQSANYSTWTKMTHTFTATATTHTMQIRGGGSDVLWDDLRLTHHVPPVTTLTPTLKLSDGDLTLNSGRYPYAEASVSVPMPDADLLEQIEDGARVTINASAQGRWVSGAWVPDTGLMADLHLVKREASYDGKELSLRLASDEAILDAWAPLTDNKTPRNYEADLRGLVNYVLGQIPGTLRNLEPNPKALSTGSAAPYGSRFAWVRSWVGNGAENVLPFGTLARFTSPESGTVAGRGIDSYGNQDLPSPLTTGDFVAGPTVTPGDTITVSRWVRMNVATPGYLLGVRFHNGAGSWVSGTSFGSWMGAGSGTAWVRVSWTGVVPAGATRFSVTTRIQSVAVTTSTFMDVTGLLTERTDRVRDWHEDVLQPGTATADLTARWNATNSILNPNVANLTGFTQAGNCTLSHGTTANAGVEGTTGFAIATSATAGQAFVQAPQAVNTRKGDMWTFSVSMFRSTGMPAVNGILRVYEMDSAGAVLRQIESTPKVIPQGGTTVPYTWDRFSLTFVVENPNTTKLAVYGSYIATAASQAVGMDGWMLTEGPLLLPFFSGSTTPAGYVTNWTGQTGPVANNSVSERRPADGIERPVELFTWKAGDSAWKFLEPLTTAAGLRLFCDEQRRWWLIDPAAWTVPGRFSARPGNTVEGTDTMDADDDETGITGVVAVFKWTDEDGVSQEAQESAGGDGKIKPLEFNRPFSPGVALAHLGKVQGQNRTQDVTCGVDYTVRPGMEIQIDLPGTNAQLGTLTSSRFELTNGLMQLQSAGLRDTPPGAIDLLNGTIDGLTGTIDGLT